MWKTAPRGTKPKKQRWAQFVPRGLVFRFFQVIFKIRPWNFFWVIFRDFKRQKKISRKSKNFFMWWWKKYIKKILKNEKKKSKHFLKIVFPSFFEKLVNFENVYGSRIWSLTAVKRRIRDIFSHSLILK